MRSSCLALHLTAALLLSSSVHLATAAPAATANAAASAATPLVIGESFTIDSQALKEQRHINVYVARAWDTPPDAPLPVLYMPDGGVAEDFLHVAGLLQVSVANGTMRPFMLVGMQNTQRRRDLTGPTDSAADRKIAPVVGGSPAYRAFIRDELMPEVKRRYRTTGETAIVGESLAGLFVVETYLLEPQLFDHYLASTPACGGTRAPCRARRRPCWPRASRASTACTWHPAAKRASPSKCSAWPTCWQNRRRPACNGTRKRCRKKAMARSINRQPCELSVPCSSRPPRRSKRHGYAIGSACPICSRSQRSKAVRRASPSNGSGDSRK